MSWSVVVAFGAALADGECIDFEMIVLVVG